MFYEMLFFECFLRSFFEAAFGALRCAIRRASYPFGNGPEAPPFYACPQLPAINHLPLSVIVAKHALGAEIMVAIVADAHKLE